MSTFVLPDLGEGLQQADIVVWHVAEGEHVVADQPLLAVETEKALVEIPSPHAGRIGKLLVRAGERVPVGAPLLVFEEGPHPDAGTVVGELSAPAQSPSPERAAPPSAPRVAQQRKPPLASPAVRARAREVGVDLAAIRPSGPDGTITIADVEAAAVPGDELLRGVRRTMAANMARAWQEVAHATLYDAADIETWPAGEDVTARLVGAIIAGCTAEPLLNASFDATRLTLRRNKRIDIGLAIDSSDGLFVPVLRDIAHSDPAQWRRQIDAAKRAVAERTLTPAELRDPTITLSNFGTIAGEHATLIVVPPQVAIVGAGRIIERPARAPTGVVLHRTLPLSLTFDHRVITGGEAARFVRAMVLDLQRGG